MTFIVGLLIYNFLGPIQAYALHKTLGWSQNTGTKDGVPGFGAFVFTVITWPLVLFVNITIVVKELSARRTTGKGLHMVIFDAYDYVLKAVKDFLT